MNTAQVLEEYRKSDYGNRLILFLTYREQRQQFYDIDQENFQSDGIFFVYPRRLFFAFPWERKHHVNRTA